MAYDKTNSDFFKYYDTTQKRNYWVLGYFGGGSINIVNAYQIGLDLSNTLNVPIDSVQIDEVFKSSRYKHFKVIYSLQDNQLPENESFKCKNVWEFLAQ